MHKVVKLLILIPMMRNMKNHKNMLIEIFTDEKNLSPYQHKNKIFISVRLCCVFDVVSSFPFMSSYTLHIFFKYSL